MLLAEEVDQVQQPLIQLRSCFKGERAKKNMKQHKITMKSHAIFCETLANDESLDFSIRERIEHNLKYNDDTIFDNLEIFQDIGETNNKVHGSKDKFNARKLLGTPIDEIPVSDEEDEQHGETGSAKIKEPREPSDDKKSATQHQEESKAEHGISPITPSSSIKLQNQNSRDHQEQIRIRMSAGDLQGFENTND